jgi:hypothetical protein
MCVCVASVIDCGEVKQAYNTPNKQLEKGQKKREKKELLTAMNNINGILTRV